MHLPRTLFFGYFLNEQIGNPQDCDVGGQGGSLTLAKGCHPRKVWIPLLLYDKSSRMYWNQIWECCGPWKKGTMGVWERTGAKLCSWNSKAALWVKRFFCIILPLRHSWSSSLTSLQRELHTLQQECLPCFQTSLPVPPWRILST